MDCQNSSENAYSIVSLEIGNPLGVHLISCLFRKNSDAQGAMTFEADLVPYDTLIITPILARRSWFSPIFSPILPHPKDFVLQIGVGHCWTSRSFQSRVWRWLINMSQCWAMIPGVTFTLLGFITSFSVELAVFTLLTLVNCGKFSQISIFPKIWSSPAWHLSWPPICLCVVYSSPILLPRALTRAGSLLCTHDY